MCVLFVEKDIQKEPQGNQAEPKGARREPEGSQREPRGAKRAKGSPKEPKGTPEDKNRRQGDQMEAPRFQNWCPKRSRNEQIEKVTNREAPKVEKLKNHKGLKDSKVKM